MPKLKRYNIPLTEKGYKKLMQEVLLSKENFSKKHFKINNQPVKISEHGILKKLKEPPNSIYCTVNDLKGTFFWLREYGLMEQDSFAPTGNGSITELKNAYKKWTECQNGRKMRSKFFFI